ncbi:MAG: ATP-dependent metallopeptidase FtsH/Yme1/Tma family protein [Ardenticatenales bacterium]|nr:ATP-dependent metallopeptidase FtsH/Yme1/Tma family protein [Ardenticatenales bacterium]
MKPAWIRNIFVYILIIVALGALFFQFLSSSNEAKETDIATVAQEIRDGNVSAIKVEGNALTVTLRDQEEPLQSRKEPQVGVVEYLRGLGLTPEQLQDVQISYERPSSFSNLTPILIYLVPLLLFGGFLIFMLRQAQGSNNQAMSFGKSRARMFTGDKPTVTFDDVAGAEEAKQELAEIVEFLKEPEKFMALGARIPKGVLMVGPPGTGKTLMARAVAGEAGVPFFSISGSEFVEMFVGVGASRVRDLFEQAKRNSPCLIFIDEIDAVGRQRGAGLGGSHDEREQTLNQILVEMDGFDSDTNIILIAATNRPDILDPALLRPGRFDRRVTLDRPDLNGRRAILEVHSRGKPLARDVDLGTVASGTPGFSGADIENLVNEAAILAARRNKTQIAMSEMQEAIERVLLGPERKSRLISEREKRIIAYHEAGHAIVKHFLPLCDPVHKITIVSRGMAGGYVLSLPDEDRMFMRRGKFMDEIAGALGGRVAEEIIFGDVTTGASSDLERVTNMARSMVTRYGMSEKLGPLTYGDREELVFLGREISEQRNYSEEVADQIDIEVRKIVEEAYQTAHAVLRDHREQLDRLAETLIETETLDRATFNALMAGETPPPNRPAPPRAARPQPTEPRESDDRASGDISFSPAPI